MSSNVTILGSTGSVGVSTLRVIKSLGKEFQVYGLSCHRNLDLIKDQIREFDPIAVAVSSDEIIKSEEYIKFKEEFPEVEFFDGEAGVTELASRRVDILVSAIVGAAGLKPTISAIPSVKRVALANKETLVMAGDIISQKVKEYGTELIPVDSEHNAIFFLLEKVKIQDIKRIILTASGGSLRDRSIAELKTVTPEEALAHPTWNMGDKITIDSATMMNKGLEVIEAHHLFDIDYDFIDVVIHPESIIHSMIETIDGAVYAYMSVADMAFPILNALTFPDKRDNDFGGLDLVKIGNLNFQSYDNNRYPALGLCYQAGKTGGTMPSVLNAANEVAVMAFLNEEIPFTDIVKIVEKIMGLHNTIYEPDINEIFEADVWARAEANRIIRGRV
ncbi:MAG: 1-deoxy-D-xylulose-5-phosphate reductoisomerase [Spirochaetota bacterium]|nr:1-deoxy-D-xylulose-5-phosphate reductoisomerase [Spirochaetota bacterium]